MKLSFIISTNDKMVFSKSPFPYIHMIYLSLKRTKKTNLIEKMTKITMMWHIYIYMKLRLLQHELMLMCLALTLNMT